jgi:GMP synthase (glutamine-hydrolysing)
MRVHIIQHEHFESPGAIKAWAEKKACDITWSRVYLQEPLPTHVESIDLLVVLGGPQSPSTTRFECPHFDAAAEKSVIARCIEARKAVFGVCLGAQLIGESLGGKFEHSAEPEIGKWSIRLTDEGLRNGKTKHFGKEVEVGHWHNDMPGLTSESKILAVSEGCARQIVEYSPLVYGFQCHFEFTGEGVELLLAASKKDLLSVRNHRFVQRPEQMRANDYREMNEKLLVFLDNLCAEYIEAKDRYRSLP